MHKNTSRWVRVRGSDAEIYAHVSDAETPCPQTRPRPQVSSDRRRSPPPLRACSSVVIQSPLWGAHLSPCCTAAICRSLPAFTHGLSLFGLPPGCISPITLISAMLSSGARTATKNSLHNIRFRQRRSSNAPSIPEYFLVILAAVWSLIEVINHQACVSGGWLSSSLSRNVISTRYDHVCQEGQSKCDSTPWQHAAGTEDCRSK